MNKNYFLLIALLISSISFGQIWSEDFGSYAENTGIEGDGAGGVANIGDYPGGVTWTLDATNSGLFNSSDFAKTVGGVFTFRDTDGAGGVTWESELINISAATSPVTFQLTASNNAGGFETSDFYNVYYSVDGGPFTLIADWNGLGDATTTIFGEKGGVDWGTVETISQSGISGSTLQIRVQALINASAEQFFLDDISVFEGAASPSLTLTAPTDNNVFAPGTTSVDVEFVAQNIDLMIAGNQVNVTVNMGATDADVTSPYAIPTTNGGTYDVTVELLEGGMVVDTKMVSFSVANITTVNNITELRAGTEGEYYELNNEAIISYIVTENTRNQKYIQDAGAGILIDDTAGTLSAPLNIGDGIFGLQGQLSSFSGVLQFVPIANVPGASSTGNSLTPLYVTANELATNGEVYESRLIRLLNVTFADMGMFSDNTNYTVTTDGGTDSTVCRVSFGDEDLIGTTIPAVAVDIIGLGGEFNGTYQILPRYAADIDTTLSNDEFDTTSFSMYPNPVNGTTVTITSASNSTKEVQVYSILGKQVINTTITNTLNVAELQTGIYVVRITENGKSATKKLVIK
ncbi:putative secreted protein (Por secretion system target) [Kordia periserrulae]|uniref:Putative secreted protein (Por secretion system target) n=1 Tax=Kordia periserrulae TaxID=701523 RepID=A0A2T6BT62_9FLAO|nr:T9SS type A sorting domain-containing protein [Kordia periserrulae]PTX59270.1 putative secreted protein (Por secretion system target) [Kordia periserrulae]